MEFKGTKAKWCVMPNGKNVRIGGEKMLRKSGAEGACMTSMARNEERRRADAQLIASAPELLEALQHGLRLADALDNKDSIAVRMFVKNARKAIDKATNPK